MNPDVLGVIIAGGQSRRFRASPFKDDQDSSPPIDKFLMPFGDTTLLDYIIQRAKKQLSNLMLNVNGDVARVMSYGLDTIGDEMVDGGPLGGVLAAMKAAKATGHRHIVTFSGDSPFFPADYVKRLVAEKNVQISFAKSGDKNHPVMGIFEVSLYDDLKAYIEAGERRVLWWIKRHSYREVVWDDINPDPFFNINCREDLAEAERYLALSFK
ncbi:MAG: molybdenum cofactor guanylyltransferase [Emcibacter sp.]|nr:molybdenum cofactor guanylyltransferase [Emcibacter sp.]